MSQKLKMNVDMNMASDVICEKCEGFAFSSCYLIKKISALVSPTGKEAIIPVETFVCNGCGHINKEFMPSLIAGNE